MYNNFGKEIRASREELNLTTLDFIAELKENGLNISPAYLSRIELNQEVPSAGVICKLCKIYNWNLPNMLSSAKKQKIFKYIEKMEYLYSIEGWDHD